MRGAAANSESQVSLVQDWLGWLVQRFKQVFVGFGNLESRIFAQHIEGVNIDRPIFIAGLARSGSTLLLELLSRHTDVVSHRYRDFPFLHVPIWWNWFLDHAATPNRTAVERAHKDRILVTPDSPEAMEEVLWMTFFPTCHDPSQSNVLDGASSYPKFEKFYVDHIRKILHLRHGTRFVSKGNYNVARLSYLAAMFSDSRFLIPVRDPVSHIASLMKQHKLFCKTEKSDARALRHMARVGHFEFGLGRTPINFGDLACTASVQRLWDRGLEVEGWAKYWSMVYAFVADCMQQNKSLRATSMIVHYSDLCAEPEKILAEIYDHCGLRVSSDTIAAQAKTISFPSYYRHGFSDEQLELIEAETDQAHSRIRALIRR